MALAGVARWVEHWTANPKVASWIPGQGTCLGCGSGSWLRTCERQPLCVCHTSVFSPSLSPSLPLSLKINKSFSFKGKTNGFLGEQFVIIIYAGMNGLSIFFGIMKLL